MKTLIGFSLLCGALAVGAFGQELPSPQEPPNAQEPPNGEERPKAVGISPIEQRPSVQARWQNSVVTLDATRKLYDYLQPWSKRLKTSQKTGLVISDREILTTADELFDRTLVRVQRQGRGKWWTAELAWIDYHANLALVTVPDDAFWDGLQPAELADPTRGSGDLQILRWRQGKMETRRADFNQFTAGEGELSFAPRLQLVLNSEIQGAGAGEPLVSQAHVEGILVSQQGNTCVAIPSSFVRSVLEARRSGEFQGLGYFDFVWQPAENPASLAFLKLEGPPRGVLVIQVPYTSGVTPVVKTHDVLLKVDGFDVDIQGDYQDPDYGHLILENLATRRKWAGDEVKLQILRDGRIQDLTYRLPKADFRNQLVPDQVFDQDPEYLIVGGLVFQPLTDAFLRSWGPEWERRSPFRLFYYNHQHPTPERPSLVLLSQVLPDVYNLGYQDLKFLVVDEVNGTKITRLPELREALKNPVDGFHIVEFVQSDSLRRLVLAADDQQPATRRVLARYGIARDYFFAEPEPRATTGVARVRVSAPANQ